MFIVANIQLLFLLYLAFFTTNYTYANTHARFQTLTMNTMYIDSENEYNVHR